MARRVREGDLYAVALGDGLEALCRVLYKSSYFRNVVLMGCYGLAGREGACSEKALSLISPPTYTGCEKKVTASWRLISTRDLSTEEKNLSKRIVGGSVWIGDSHIGPASAVESSTLPKMSVYASKLFIKKLRQECLNEKA